MDILLRTIGTLTLLSFALAHGLVSTFKVDGYTIMLLLFAFIPWLYNCLLYTSPSPRDGLLSRMPSSA